MNSNPRKASGQDIQGHTAVADTKVLRSQSNGKHQPQCFKRQETLHNFKTMVLGMEQVMHLTAAVSSFQLQNAKEQKPGIAI